MASGVYFGLGLSILIIFVVHVGSYPNRYAFVVSDIHEYYRTSSVFFVLSRNNRHLEDYTSIHSLSRNFSRKYDFTSMMHFDQLDECTKWYHKRIGSSLLVIFLRSLSDIDEVTRITKFRRKSYIWLMIFSNESRSSGFCEYCNTPKGNRFRLRFDTEMLVLCCDSLVLKEWWSIDGDHTEVSDFAVWTDKHRRELTFLAPADLGSRRNDVKGADIRIGLAEGSPFALETDDEFEGFFGEILNELKRSMNFTITEIVRSSDYGVWNFATKNWTGLIGRLTQGEFDLGVADFNITPERQKVIAYTLPLAVSKNELYIRDEKHTDVVYWTAYFQSFSVNVWIVTIVLIIVAPILLAMMRVLITSRSLPSLIVETYLHVWGICCQQGLCEFPAEASLRIAYFSIFILALIIYAAYSASLVSFLTVSPSNLPFTTLEGFVDDGSYQLIAYRNHVQYEYFTSPTVPVLRKMTKLMKPVAELPQSLRDGWEQVCQEKAALFTEDLFAARSQWMAKCKFSGIYSGYKNVLAMIIPHDSQYSEAINYHFQRFKDTGLLNRLKHKYLDITYTSAEAKFDELNLWNVMPVLVFLTIGIIFALLVLLGEAIHHAVENDSGSKPRGKNLQDCWENSTDVEELSINQLVSVSRLQTPGSGISQREQPEKDNRMRRWSR